MCVKRSGYSVILGVIVLLGLTKETVDIVRYGFKDHTSLAAKVRCQPLLIASHYPDDGPLFLSSPFSLRCVCVRAPVLYRPVWGFLHVWVLVVSCLSAAPGVACLGCYPNERCCMLQGFGPVRSAESNEAQFKMSPGGNAASAPEQVPSCCLASGVDASAVDETMLCSAAWLGTN